MVAIITDTTSCLSEDFAQKYQIPVIPQVINFENESFYEGRDLTIEQFMERLRKAKNIPKTAAPPPELFIPELARLVDTAETILCIHPSAEISGTVRSASVARQDFPKADIRIIDTRTVGSQLGTMVQLAAIWAKDGVDADIIETRLNELISRGRIYFLVPTLEFLQKGGRIGGAQALLGSVLQIKPILCLKDGRVDRYESERTQKRAYTRLIELVNEQYPRHQEGHLSVMHAGVPDQGSSLAEELGKMLQLTEVPVFNVPPAIVTHGGPGILAASFFA
jgi:fatty acid kinase fatty acid binding subunit